MATDKVLSGVKKNLNSKKKWREFTYSLPLTMLATPAIVFLFIFNYLPLYGLILPFKNYRSSQGFWGSEWSGLDNFKFLFNNPEITSATINTIGYNVIFIVLGTVVAILLAFMLFELRNSFVKVYQTTLFLPHFISWVVVAYAARVFLDMDYGLLNKLLAAVGKEPIMWYNKPEYWPVILIIAELWKTAGYNAVIYYAALMGTDKSVFEAAKIDGAGKFKQIWHVALPGIKPIIIVMTILKIGKIFYGDFGLFYNLTFNSPLLYSTTDIIDTYVYRSLITLGDVGMSSAAGFYQAVLGFLLVVITNWVVDRIDSENALF
jgi:putative aldouronate transport system permease protein